MVHKYVCIKIAKIKIETFVTVADTIYSKRYFIPTYIKYLNKLTWV